MQPPTVPPRDGLTNAQVVALLRDAPATHTEAGLELLDQDLAVQADLSDVFEGGSVTREAYADLHGSATLDIEADLDWGTAIVRPFIVLSAGGVSARFNLGAYYTPTPTRSLEVDPVVYQVRALDILDGLNSPVGEAYGVAAGVSYLSTVDSILTAQGFSQYAIDLTAAAAVLPTARTWVMDERTTWLSIVNDLLASIGYQGIWSDWDGRLRVQPYLSPTQRGPEWRYDVDAATSMLTPARALERDWYRAPNRWVFWRSNNADGPAPVEGDGVYTFVNEADGPTSVQARNGRVITKPVPLDVADHAALVAAAQITIDADLRLESQLRLGTAPNPLHWHMDRLTVADPAVGRVGEALVTRWTLPLPNGDMSHEWTLLTRGGGAGAGG